MAVTVSDDELIYFALWGLMPNDVEYQNATADENVTFSFIRLLFGLSSCSETKHRFTTEMILHGMTTLCIYAATSYGFRMSERQLFRVNFCSPHWKASVRF
jgi:hypothetical protein